MNLLGARKWRECAIKDVYKRTLVCFHTLSPFYPCLANQIDDTEFEDTFADHRVQLTVLLLPE